LESSSSASTRSLLTSQTTPSLSGAVDFVPLKSTSVEAPPGLARSQAKFEPGSNERISAAAAADQQPKRLVPITSSNKKTKKYSLMDLIKPTKQSVRSSVKATTAKAPQPNLGSRPPPEIAATPWTGSMDPTSATKSYASYDTSKGFVVNTKTKKKKLSTIKKRLLMVSNEPSL
jgi:hypothetical protein